MRRAGVVAAMVLALGARAQTRIASDVEIRELEEAARGAADFDTKVAAQISLGELRKERNEPAAEQRDLLAALQLARNERDDARRDHHLPRYAVACAWSGIALAGLGRGAEAFAVLEEAVRYAADTSGIWNLYSVAMFRLARPEKAIGVARISIDAGERKMAARSTIRGHLDLNVSRFALAQGLLDAGAETAAGEAGDLLRAITESLESDAFASLRKTLERREEFQIVAAPKTESGTWLAMFQRSHLRLAQLYELDGLEEKALREYQAVVTRRSDEPSALAGLARLASDPKERDRYLIQSLDANPFAGDVIAEYEDHVKSGEASPAGVSGSVGSRVRLAIQQIHDHDFRRARETLAALIAQHPGNDVLQSLLERAVPAAERPSFLSKPVELVPDPLEWELRAVMSLFADDKLSPADQATLDRTRFSGKATFEGEAFEHGTMRGVSFRFQQPVQFEGIAPTHRRLRLVYRILGATAVDGRDALLIEPLRAEVDP